MLLGRVRVMDYSEYVENDSAGLTSAVSGVSLGGRWMADLSSSCLVGAHCSHAVLTVEIGVYKCPFGSCFKRRGA
jgi:hypothetical protein